MCDKITVLRDGKLVGQYTVAELPRVQLVAKMLGKEFDDVSEIKSENKPYESESDIPLFEACDRCCAVGNAHKEVKERADYVLDTNLNAGVVKFLEEEMMS